MNLNPNQTKTATSPRGLGQSKTREIHKKNFGHNINTYTQTQQTDKQGIKVSD